MVSKMSVGLTEGRLRTLGCILLNMGSCMAIRTIQDVGEPPFMGLSYNSWKVKYECPSYEEVLNDISNAKRYTNRVRLHGTQCPLELDLLLQETYTDEAFSVFIGVWINWNETSNSMQMQSLLTALENHPHARIYAISIGNEVLLRKDMSEDTLIDKIRDARGTIRELGYKHDSNVLQTVPVLTVETLGDVSDKLIQEIDIVCVNMHPFHGQSHRGYNVTASILMDDVLGSYEYAKKKVLPYGKHVVVGEVGWPASSESWEKNEGSLEMEKNFMKAFIAYAKQANIDYFWFELYDGTWKVAEQPPNRTREFSEFNWGLMKEDHVTDKNLLD